MLISDFLLPNIQHVSSEVKMLSHNLMLRSGMIKQLSSGVYIWLPLGMRVLNKIVSVVKGELDNIGANEVLCPYLQPLDLWKTSKRALDDSDMKDQIFHLKGRSGHDYVLPPSAEEVANELFKYAINSYQDLGKIIYQIGWKFRDEIRPRYGIMRAKEFLMKDAYALDVNDSLPNYKKIFKSYLKIFRALDIRVLPVLAPTGAMGGVYSHEFHVLSENGESVIYHDKDVVDYVNKTPESEISFDKFEKFYSREEGEHDYQKKDCIIESRGIEIGHMFCLGDKYSKLLGCRYQDSNGKQFFPHMSCYGIGVSRLIAAIIEVHNDEKGMVWPKLIAPFNIGIVNCIDSTKSVALDLYETLVSNKISVLYDDSNLTIGKKLNRMELIGVTKILIVGANYTSNKLFELKDRITGKVDLFDKENIIKMALAL